MKVNVQQRAIAKQVMETGCPYGERPEPTTEKANIYGLAAFHISHISLERVRTMVMAQRYEQVASVAISIGSALRAQFFEHRGLYDRKSLDEAVIEREVRHGGLGILPSPGGERLETGIMTALDSVSYTLRTAQYKSETQRSITRVGLLASQRVTFESAMVHRAATNVFNCANGVLDVPRQQLSNDDHGFIFSDRVIAYDSDMGLTFRPEVEFIPSPVDDNDPLIGCPATLIKGFIRGLHSIGADAVIDSGIITLQAA